jgi:hypothetical protein
MFKRRKPIVFLLTLGLVAVAVMDQLRRPDYERTWEGRIFGIIPYDFRIPTPERIKSAWWNPDDPRLFTSRAFGIGWDVNIPRLLALFGHPVAGDSDTPSVPPI